MSKKQFLHFNFLFHPALQSQITRVSYSKFHSSISDDLSAEIPAEFPVDPYVKLSDRFESTPAWETGEDEDDDDNNINDSCNYSGVMNADGAASTPPRTPDGTPRSRRRNNGAQTPPVLLRRHDDDDESLLRRHGSSPSLVGHDRLSSSSGEELR